MDQIEQFVEPMKQFSKDSIRLVKRCTKPDRKGKKEFKSLRKKMKSKVTKLSKFSLTSAIELRGANKLEAKTIFCSVFTLPWELRNAPQ